MDVSMTQNQQSFYDLIMHLKTDRQKGLSETEAQQRLQIFGLNTVKRSTPPTFFRIFIAQFFSPLVYLLIISGIIIFFAEPMLKCPCAMPTLTLSTCALAAAELMKMQA